jgi:hypothetical protein
MASPNGGAPYVRFASGVALPASGGEAYLVLDME